MESILSHEYNEEWGTVVGKSTKDIPDRVTAMERRVDVELRTREDSFVDKDF